MDFITTIKDAQFLLNETVIAVDIETDTRPPHDGWGSTYGLSHVADITWVSLFAYGHPPVVFDMQSFAKEADTLSWVEHANFIAEVLGRPGIRIIAHNATFDLRNLGSHYGFTVHLESDVWDTSAMARLLMMGSHNNRRFGLENLLEYHELFIDAREAEFTSEMKKHRVALHLVENDHDVLKYVALDSYKAYMLYDLQRAIIRTSSLVDVEPKLMFITALEWYITDLQKPFRHNRFNATKSWSKLEELVEWEVRIHRWSANAAIKGVRFNKEYSQQHMKQIMNAFGTNIGKVIENFVAYLDADISTKSGSLSVQQYVVDIINTEREEQNSKPRDIDWFYYVDRTGHVLLNYEKRTRENLVYYFQGWFNQLIPDEARAVTRFRAEIAADWYIEYYGSHTEIPDEQLVNKPLFKKFYVFCIAGVPLPTNEDIVSHTFLVSGDLKENAESGLALDYVTGACETQKFSMGSDSLDFYHNLLWQSDSETDLDEDDYEHPVLYPYMEVLDNKAKLNRIKEFWKHAERDGRIHSLIVRATNTGRMSSSQMNLQNIKMKYYKGYLVADDENHVLGGIDVSNAENFFAALTFGDSELSKACVFGDFHETMSRAYWGDDYIDDLMENDWDKFYETRKRGKSITFGGAYGAGAAKIARMVGCTPEEARILLMNRDLRFPKYAEGKKNVQRQAEACKAKGFKPSFTTLWSGRRVAIAEYRAKRRRINSEGKIEEYWEDNFGGYKAVNYLQQGGVGELILRAQVLSDEEFESRGWTSTHIPLQVHDELIVHAHVDNFFEACQIICRNILEAVPEEFRNRTVPAVRFLAAIGIENKYKWGYNPLVEYPIDPKKFVNAWGVFDLPDSEIYNKHGELKPEKSWEAPTWISDPEDDSEPTTKDEDWTRYYGTQTDDTPEVKVVPASVNWKQFRQGFERAKYISNTFEDFQTPIMLEINGQERGPFDFTNKMVLLHHLHHAGHDPSEMYWNFWSQVDELIKLGDTMRELKEQYFEEKSDASKV